MASEKGLEIRKMLMENRIKTGIKDPIDFLKDREEVELQYAGRPLTEGCKYQRTVLGGVDAEWIIPDGAPSDKAILYIHGGGFACFSIDSTRFLAAEMAKAAGITVLSAGYRLAPEHPYPAASEDCLALYRELLRKGLQSKNIAITGESAGGMLSLATVLALKSAGEPLPAAVAVTSPLTDMTLSGDSIRTRGASDPVLSPVEVAQMIRAFAPGQDLNFPALSPLFGDLNGFPPLLVQVGTEEILLSDSLRLADQAASAGVRVKLKVWEGMFHGFHSFPGEFAESDGAVTLLGKFMRRILYGA